jgi:predicted extracellular nuclease
MKLASTSMVRRMVWSAVALAPMLCAGCKPDSDPEDIRAAQAALGPPNPAIVISQVYGGGGNSGAPFKNDFVELFNRSQSTVTMTNWSVQYASATGTGNFNSNPVTTIDATLAPGQYLLVQMAAGTGTAPALPTPDVNGSVNLSATGGKVVLVNTNAGLACNGGSTSCTAAQEASIVDLVGWDGANYFESAPAPATTNPTAVLRKNAGCVDTNNNQADFTVGAPTPRNTASALAPCPKNLPPTVSSTVPANSASGVAATSTITVAFSEPVVTSGTWYTISCTRSGSVSALVSGGPTTFTLTPTVTLSSGETCNVNISAAGVTDVDAVQMVADYPFSFTVALPLTPIHTIQGATHLSPLANSPVRTSGIVTAVRSNGYNLQDPSPDADDSTSEGIFVFTSSIPTVRVGDAVEVSGRVSEFRPGCSSGCSSSSSAFNNLTVTEITGPTSTVISSGNALPSPIVIGVGGRTPPNAVIENDISGSVETDGNVFDPAEDGIDFYESLEGMRVQINDALVVGPTKLFGSSSKETYIVGDNGASAGPRTARGGLVIAPGDFNPERLVLANDIVPTLPDANVGDTFPGAIVGVLDYDFANYRILHTNALPALQDNGLVRETLSFAAPSAADLNIAAFNVENLDPNDPPQKFTELAAIIVNGLRSPDILALEEVQDNDGATDNGVVDATVTFNKLIATIADAGGPAYQFRSIDPVDGQDGGEPGGNIRVGFLFRTDRGVDFVDRPGAGSLTANSVTSTNGVVTLQYSPGRIDPTNVAFNNSRKPLAAEFTFNGITLFVVANHFNSKGGDQPLFGRFQPPTLSSQTQRMAQAQVVGDFVSQILAEDTNANVIVLGDLNDFQFSAPLNVLKNAGLTTLIETLPAPERYTYVFEGNSQVLDHVLVSPHALSRTAGFDVVHVNAEFASQASDHDPGVARLNLDAVAPVVTSPGDQVAEATGPRGAVVAFTVTSTDNLDGSLPVTCVPASGSQFARGTTQVTCSATDAQGNVGQARFAVIVEDTTAPDFTNVPSAIAAYATTAAGAVVTYTDPTATDLVDGSVSVACAPPSGSTFAPGSTTVTCSAADAAGNQATRQFAVTVTFSAPEGSAIFQQPINSDGSSIFKLGRTVPVKFALTGSSAGITDLVAHLTAAKVSNGIEGTVVEVSSNGPGDGCNTFRYDPTARQYILNLSAQTPTFTQGTWALYLNLGDGTTHSVHISMRQ